MVTTLQPLRSVFHSLCHPPPPNVFPATRVIATLPQPAPYNRHSNHPINTTDGCYNNPLVIPGYSPSKRYQPYPQPQCLPPGQLLVFGQRKSAKRHGPRHQPVDLRLNGGVPPAPVYIPHLKYDPDVMTAVHLIFPIAEDYNIEMCEETYAQEAGLVDIEMEDVFLPPIPSIMVMSLDDSCQQPPPSDIYVV